MGRGRRILLHAALVAFGLTLGALGAEVALRMAGAGAPAELGPEFDRAIVFPLPQPTRQHPWARGADSVLRIAAVGDSFTVGETNAWDDAFPSRLERLLNLNDGVTPAMVQVWAKKGTATIEQIPFLRRAINSGTDLVILGITLNDPEAPGDPRIRAWRDEMMPREPTGTMRRVLTASRLFGTVYQRLEVLRARRAQRGYVDYLYDTEYEGWKKFEHSLLRFGRICRLKGVPLVAVVFPTMSGLGPNYGMRFAHDQIGEALQAVGIRHLDLLDEFTPLSDARMSAFAEIDAHPSEIAHRVAADAIFRFLLDEGLIDQAYRPESVLVERPMHEWLRLTRRMRSVLAPGDPVVEAAEQR